MAATHLLDQPPASHQYSDPPTQTTSALLGTVRAVVVGGVVEVVEVVVGGVVEAGDDSTVPVSSVQDTANTSNASSAAAELARLPIRGFKPVADESLNLIGGNGAGRVVPPLVEYPFLAPSVPDRT